MLSGGNIDPATFQRALALAPTQAERDAGGSLN
jgi:hypothetical protein